VDRLVSVPVLRARLSRPIVRATAGLVAAGAFAMVLALLLGGGAPRRDRTGLADTDLVTAWAQPLLRLVSDVSAVGCVGALVAAAVLLPADGGRVRTYGRRAVDDAALLAGIWSLAALAGCVASATVILGVRMSELPDRLDDAVALKDVRVLAVSAVLASFAAAAVSGTDTRLGAWAGLSLAVAALVPPLLVGHAWGDQVRIPAVGARILHVLAAAVWVGGLAAVARYGSRLGAGELPALVSAFSRIALWCAVTVGLSGLLVALLHLGGRGGSFGDAVNGLFTRAYGGVVLAKLAAFVVIVTAGWWHRRQTIASLRSGSTKSFWRLVAAELTVMLAAIGLAVALSRTP
jgi:putative copper export protein